MNEADIITKFKQEASLVSAAIHEADSIDDAFKIAVSLCHGDRIIAAPDMESAKYELLEKICLEHRVTLLRTNLRNHTNGINMGITFADFGIAETGTVVINSNSEDKRLATMISEIHLALLYRSDIRRSALDMADELSELTARPSSYTAFITGASRTADIERVLAIGVHGPLELHIILLDKRLNHGKE